MMGIQSLFHTPISKCYGVVPDIYKDNRGEFLEIYNEYEYTDLALLNWCQDNVSISKKSVLRGFHFQKGKFAQNKLVSVLRGSVLDVVIDCRQNSPSYGQHYTISLSNLDRKQLFVPAGCAHGFLSLEDDTIVIYKCDMPYNKDSEGGINPLDSTLDVWKGFKKDMFIVSEKDQQLPNWENCYKFE